MSGRRGDGPGEEPPVEHVEDFEYWHYAFDLGAAGRTRPVRREYERRHEQRLRHVMDGLLPRIGGSLEGLRVLDVGCNAGFWSFHALRLGAASVLGIDRYPDHIRQAELVRDRLGLSGVEFRVLDVFDARRDELGTFDVVLFLGLLYHLDRPIHALRLMRDLTAREIVVDTQVLPVDLPIAEYSWETDEMRGVHGYLVEIPSVSALRLMLEHTGFGDLAVLEAGPDMPSDYRSGGRVTVIASATTRSPALRTVSGAARIAATMDRRFVQDTIVARTPIARFLIVKARRWLARLPLGARIEVVLRRLLRRVGLH